MSGSAASGATSAAGADAPGVSSAGFETAPYVVPSLRWPDQAIVLSDVSVRYRLPSERITSLKEAAVRRLTGRSVKYSEFWALRHVDMEVHRGEAIGLVGRNGAGKSTLLKVIARVQKPSSGRIWVRGHVSPLIELGAGFHHELTGRENVFINGAMLGFSHKQMQRKFDRIVEFSGLKDFIDAPLRTYSSGMIARLGFSIAADADPDILIIDEALSVGDEEFQKKCIARMRGFREQGVTIFFVTHGLDTLKSLCPKSVWIDGGHVRAVGPTESVVASFRASLENDVSIMETRKMQVVRVERSTGKERAVQ
jgi:ABC-type polysaccharide/polyol phosphate transport system ATPase subunit